MEHGKPYQTVCRKLTWNPGLKLSIGTFEVRTVAMELSNGAVHWSFPLAELCLFSIANPELQSAGCGLGQIKGFTDNRCPPRQIVFQVSKALSLSLCWGGGQRQRMGIHKHLLTGVDWNPVLKIWKKSMRRFLLCFGGYHSYLE